MITRSYCVVFARSQSETKVTLPYQVCICTKLFTSEMDNCDWCVETGILEFTFFCPTITSISYFVSIHLIYDIKRFEITLYFQKIPVARKERI